MKCLVAIPYQAHQVELWVPYQQAMCASLATANPGWEFTIALHQTPFLPRRNRQDFLPHAIGRNDLLDHWLGESSTYDYVLWIDSDLTQWPRDWPTVAHAQNPGGLTAPAAVVDTMPWRFYDITGFVDAKGKHAQFKGPWFSERSAVIEMTTVGCMYLAPADLYYEGVRYQQLGGGHTEHYSVCKAVRERGRKVLCLLRYAAYHAYLPDYGGSWH